MRDIEQKQQNHDTVVTAYIVNIIKRVLTRQTIKSLS